VRLRGFTVPDVLLAAVGHETYWPSKCRFCWARSKPAEAGENHGATIRAEGSFWKGKRGVVL
jgi:hypothetical protein